MSSSREMDRAQIWNPYDFANPVNDDALFAGRERELADIRYYLGQAARAPRPINLVLTGPRSSGKTSLLNKIAHEARDQDFCIARIDLNEGDASPLNLFYKIYDAVIVAAVTDGAFAGPSGSIYRSYRLLMDCGTADDSIDSNLLFPRHYAAASNGSRLLSEPTLKSDLATIANELHKPCVLLFDECDVLANSRIELEMLRNVFMNTPGYMLVLAGTPNLFPVMEEVFSPIVRQFKKIPVNNFKTLEETTACIAKPLQQVGLSRDNVALTRLTLTDIHRISDGRPYEIQLLCHYMFRRFQEGRANSMAITVDVLDEVLRELETQESSGSRSSVTALRHTSKADLEALSILTQARTSLHHLWLLSILFDHAQITLEELRAAFGRFKNLHILDGDEDEVRFSGDQFDEVYARYAAASNNVRLLVRSYPFDVAVLLNLTILLSEANSYRSVLGPDRSDADARRRLDLALATLLHPTRPYALPDLTEALYGAVLRSIDLGSIAIVKVVMKISDVEVSAWGAVIDEEEFLSDSVLVRLTETTSSVGGEFTSEIFNREVPKDLTLVDRARSVATLSQQQDFASAHSDYGYDLHKERLWDRALHQFSAALALWPTVSYATACAHLSILEHKWREAESFAVFARQLYDEDNSSEIEQYLIATYDLAVSMAGDGNFDAAREYLRECHDTAISVVDSSGFFAVPYYDSAEILMIREIKNLNEAIASLSAFCGLL